jgi:hypothetical protein
MWDVFQLISPTRLFQIISPIGMFVPITYMSSQPWHGSEQPNRFNEKKKVLRRGTFSQEKQGKYFKKKGKTRKKIKRDTPRFTSYVYLFLLRRCVARPDTIVNSRTGSMQKKKVLRRDIPRFTSSVCHGENFRLCPVERTLRTKIDWLSRHNLGHLDLYLNYICIYNLRAIYLIMGSAIFSKCYFKINSQHDLKKRTQAAIVIPGVSPELFVLHRCSFPWYKFYIVGIRRFAR